MGFVHGGVVVVAALLAQAQAPETLDRILAVVNGDMVTLSDVRAARALKLVPGDDTDEAIVRQLVERRLVVAELRRFQVPDAPAETVAARVRSWSAALGADPAAVFARVGVGEEFVSRWLNDDLRRDSYLTQRFAALPADRRAEAIRLWLDSLRLRAEIVYRTQRV